MRVKRRQALGGSVRRLRFLVLLAALGAATAAFTAPAWAAPGGQPGAPTSTDQPGPPPGAGDGVVHVAGNANNAKAHGQGATKQLQYRGGAIESQPGIYLVLWGSQWSSDPSGEAAYLQRFYGGLYGSSDTWSTSTTQYCSGVAAGTTLCPSTANHVQHPASNPLRGVWLANGSAAPSAPTQSQLAGEAIAAAAHFGNTASGSNANVQYVIATAHNNNSSGFGVQYCAWHSSTSSSYGTIAYTNLPYITDAGWSCGANFVNSTAAGALDGVSIVGGHEYAESVTDPYPNGGWLDSGGAENGDKCAWLSSGQGAAADINLSTGTFAVQSLWSNSFNNNAGGCVISYVNSGGSVTQH